MPLYVKDPEVDRLIEQLAARRKASKTEIVRQALRHEMTRDTGADDLVQRGIAFLRTLKDRSSPAEGLPADKTFIDDLYGEP